MLYYCFSIFTIKKQPALLRTFSQVTSLYWLGFSFKNIAKVNLKFSYLNYIYRERILYHTANSDVLVIYGVEISLYVGGKNSRKFRRSYMLNKGLEII